MIALPAVTLRTAGRALAAVLAVAGIACQGGGSAGGPAAGSGSAPAASDAPAGAARSDAAGAPADDARDDERPPADQQIEDLGAVPAWQAVVDRDRYLARRGQHGVVYGTVGAAIAPTGDPTATGMVWLVDDTEGNGALAIRIRWPDGTAPPAEGDRVAAGGAWALDDERQWVWRADRWSPLPAPTASAPAEPAAAPGHVVGAGDPPSGWKPVSQAKDDGVISFQIVGAPPINEGDGWMVADELGDAPVAILVLPGERPSYGAHDLRSADEKWRLKRGVDYWVRTGRIRTRSVDELPTITARTAPVRW